MSPSKSRSARYSHTAMRQRDERLLREGRPNPKRITLALDAAGLWGPEVDLALGGKEPMVDEWEAGTRVPTPEQIRALSELTGCGIKFFYEEDPSRAPVWMCGRGICEYVHPEPHPSDPVAEVVPLFGQRVLL